MENKKKCLKFGQKTYTMGILNITPDSFSDGGDYFDSNRAYERVLNLVNKGADIIDIGAESSRPGSDPIDEKEEWLRLEPVLKKICNKIEKPISLDTYKSSVAEKALKLGVEIINDISGLKSDLNMAKVIAKYNAYVVIMHMRGKPKTMQDNPSYEDVIKEVKDELEESINIALEAGIKRDKIILDPGIGFGKRFEDNLMLLNKLEELQKLGYPLLVGASRKRFIGDILGTKVGKRLEGSLAVATIASIKGVDILRVHDVEETVKALKVVDAIKNV